MEPEKVNLKAKIEHDPLREEESCLVKSSVAASRVKRRYKKGVKHRPKCYNINSPPGIGKWTFE